MELWWLLLRHYSYLPIPQRWQEQPAQLPRALCLLPFYGLIAGLLCWGVTRFTWVLGSCWAAAALLGLTILLNGGVWLRDVLLIASGRPTEPQTEAGNDLSRERFFSGAQNSDTRYGVQRHAAAALLVGVVYLLLQYGCFLALARYSRLPTLYVAAAVFSRWVYLWGAYDFAALAPAFLHQGVSRQSFAMVSGFSLLVLAFCASSTPALWPALLIAALAALLLYHSRRRALGALDEAAYGAAAAWSEIALYLSYLIFSVWL